jgi:tetratricopeptide (TPR) repeat protein
MLPRRAADTTSAVSLSDIAVPAAVLALFAVLLPRPLPQAAADGSDARCLTLVDDETRSADGQPGPLDLYERCSGLHPADVELLAALGVRYEADGQPGKAEAIYRRALDTDPSYADLRLRLGRLLLARGEADDARRQAELGLQVQPNRLTLLDLARDAGRHRPAGTR